MPMLAMSLCPSCCYRFGVAAACSIHDKPLLPESVGRSAAAASCKPRRPRQGLLLASLPRLTAAADIELAMEPPDAAASR